MTGTVSSFVAKYKSTEDKKIPLSDSKKILVKSSTSSYDINKSTYSFTMTYNGVSSDQIYLEYVNINSAPAPSSPVPDTGQALVPYYRQILPVFNIFIRQNNFFTFRNFHSRKVILNLIFLIDD